MIHPFNDEGAYKRLLSDYKRYKTLVVGFDFDNTIYDYWNNGGNYNEIIELLKECKALNFNLCLYSVEDRIDEKYKICSRLDIKPDYVNKSPVIFEAGKVKPYFNILLDDRAGLESAYNILKKVIEYVKKDRNIL